jgi:hypothetical protein
LKLKRLTDDVKITIQIWVISDLTCNIKPISSKHNKEEKTDCEGKREKKTRKSKKLRSSLHHSNNSYTEISRDLQKQSCMVLNTYHNVPTDFIIISSRQWVKRLMSKSSAEEAGTTHQH